VEAGGGWRRRAPRPHAATLFSSSLQLSAVDGLGGAAADAASLAAAAEARAEAAEAELEAARDRSLRLTADFDNFRKRSDAEKAAAGDAARASAVEALIPLADSFDAARGAVAPATEGEEKIAAAFGVGGRREGGGASERRAPRAPPTPTPPHPTSSPLPRACTSSCWTRFAPSA
jgi:hypothetical protein